MAEKVDRLGVYGVVANPNHKRATGIDTQRGKACPKMDEILPEEGF